MTAPDRFTSRAVDLGRLAEQSKARAEDALGVAGFVEITQQNAENELIRRSAQVPVVALIGTARSPESEQLKADLKALAEAQEHPRFVVAYLDADREPQLAQALGVRGLPTVLALAAGRPVSSFEGGQPAEQLAAWVGALVEQIGPQLEGLPATEGGEETSDPRLAEAAALVDAGDFQVALGIYDAVLAEGPDPEATQARGLALVRQRLARRGEEAAAEPEAFLAADRAILAGRPEEAFEGLVAVLRSSAGAEQTATKERLISLFEIFGNTDERVRQARSAMASALF